MSSSIDRIRTASWLNLAALAVAAIALFVALGGTSYAAGGLIGAKKIKNNSIGSKKLKNNSVRSVDLTNGTIQLTDLSGPLLAKVNEVAGGLVDTGQLANGSVTNPKLADNSVNSAKVASNTLTASDIAVSAIAGGELSSNSVQGDEVENGSLDAVDVGQYSGSAGANFGVIPAGSCGTVTIDPTPGSENIDDRASVVTPGPGFGGHVSFHAETEGSTLLLKACNPTAAASNPDGNGTNYNYILFG